MASQKIGVIDSGVGGLSVLQEIRNRMPDLDIHYVGDSAWCPYGSRSPGEICQRVSTIVEYLYRLDVSLVVIACNSATIHAVEWLRNLYPIPLGMEPGVKPACSLTKTGVIGVLATEASIAGEKFLKLVDSTANGVSVITQPCPKFVELVENGQLEGREVDSAIHEYTDHIIARDADVLVLGCTHYPFIRHAITQIIPDRVEIIETGEPVARRAASLIGEDTGGKGNLIVETSGDLEVLERLLPVLLPGIACNTGVTEF